MQYYRHVKYLVKYAKVSHIKMDIWKRNSIIFLLIFRKKISSSGNVKVEDFDQKLAETDIYLQMLLNQVNWSKIRI